jgi:lipoyl(octanoyl) transferase
MSYSQPNKLTTFQHLGLIRYQDAWDYQTNLFNQLVALKLENRRNEDAGLPTKQTDNYLIFCQHPHVYTLGKSGHAENLLLRSEGLQAKGIEYFQTNRGGDITYHGPGQLVGYPILDLDNFFTDIHRYMRTIEEAIIQTLATYGIVAGRIAGLTGVWLDHITQKNPRKICAIGVKMSRWVTMHGFALNVNTDLGLFDFIVPCGISDKAVTSLAKELGHEVDMNEVEERLKKQLSEQFGMELIG